FFFISPRPPPSSPLFPYTTLFRSADGESGAVHRRCLGPTLRALALMLPRHPKTVFINRYYSPDESATAQLLTDLAAELAKTDPRSEEHTSELQSLTNLVCRLLLEK